MRDLLFVSAGLDLHGGGRAAAGRLLAASCAEYAAQRGLHLSILSLAGGFPVDGIPVATFGGRQGALAMAVWRRQAGSDRPAVVYDLLGPARIAAWTLPPLRAPYLVPLYGIEVWRPLRGARLRALNRATVRLAISAYTARRAREANPGLRAEIAVLPLCLEEREPEGRVDPEVLARAGEGYILIVGRMQATERYKGHEALLAALPPGARLVVAGDGDDRPRLLSLARQAGVAERVLFTGFVSEATLAELYRRAAVFAMPSWGEGFGLVYLEAMRAGKPCVALADTAAAEIVAGGETGLLVPQGDPAALSSALARLFAEPDLARRFGAAGERRYREVYSRERFRAGLAPLLDRLRTA